MHCLYWFNLQLTSVPDSYFLWRNYWFLQSLFFKNKIKNLKRSSIFIINVNGCFYLKFLKFLSMLWLDPVRGTSNFVCQQCIFDMLPNFFLSSFFSYANFSNVWNVKLLSFFLLINFSNLALFIAFEIIWFWLPDPVL